MCLLLKNSSTFLVFSTCQKLLISYNLLASYRWNYAINGILEVHVRRYTRMWTWSNIRHHRQLLRNYKNVYKNKLTQTKVSEETQKQMQVLDAILERLFLVLNVRVNIARNVVKLCLTPHDLLDHSMPGSRLPLTSKV